MDTPFMADEEQTPQPQRKKLTPQKPLNDKLTSSPSSSSLSLPDDFSVPEPELQVSSIPDYGPLDDFEYQYDCHSFSKLLKGFVAASGIVLVDSTDFNISSSLDSMLDNVGSEGHLEMSHQEVLASVTAKAAEAQAQVELETESEYVSAELPPITLYDSSVPNTTPITEKPSSTPGDDANLSDMDKNNFSNHKAKSTHSIMKTPAKAAEAQAQVELQTESGYVSAELAPMTLYDSSVPNTTPITEKPSSTPGEDANLSDMDKNNFSNHKAKSSIMKTPAKAAEAQAQVELQTESGYVSSELAPVTLYDSSVPNTTPITKKPTSTPGDDANLSDMDKNNFSNYKPKSSHSIMKTPATDGYNWRKYGQKQVKSAEGSRSYYRCSHSDCHAKKKVQRCDHSGDVIEIVYDGPHSHELPQNIRHTVNYPVQKPDDSDLSIIKQDRQDSLPTLDLEKQNYSNSDGNADIRDEEEKGDELEPRQRIEPQKPTVLVKGKRPRHEISGTDAEEDNGSEQKQKQRMEEITAAYSAPKIKTIESRFVVHAAGDAEKSSDGYRWRKYGQKMVKGSPYPRSYYKCTSAGCAVRKQVERATVESTVIIITYEGKHDHNMPVPKERTVIITTN